MIDYYKILGISKNASADDIKRAYRKLASQYHPDHGGNTDQFQEIQAAYSTLSDPDKKQLYDNPIQSHGFFDHNFSPFDFFQQNFVRRPTSKIILWLDIRDILTSSRKIVSVDTGSGSIHHIQIDIPPGVDDGHIVKYQNLGPHHQDLVVVFKIKPDQTWIKSGQDLITNCNVSIWKLITGGQQEIIDPVGNQLSVTIPPYTRPNAIMRIRSRGFLNTHGHRGDLLMKIHADLPEKISAELLDMIKKESQA